MPVLGASPCLCLQDASIIPIDPCKTKFSLCYFRYNDVRLSFRPSCLLLDARGRQTYQLTAFKPQPQLSQKQIVKMTAITLFGTLHHAPSGAICRAVASEFILIRIGDCLVSVLY